MRQSASAGAIVVAVTTSIVISGVLAFTFAGDRISEPSTVTSREAFSELSEGRFRAVLVSVEEYRDQDAITIGTGTPTHLFIFNATAFQKRRLRNPRHVSFAVSDWHFARYQDWLKTGEFNFQLFTDAKGIVQLALLLGPEGC
jgi:hypothetical protein